MSVRMLNVSVYSSNISFTSTSQPAQASRADAAYKEVVNLDLMTAHLQTIKGALGADR